MSVLTLSERAPSDKPKHLRRQGIMPMALVEKKGGTKLYQAPIQEVRYALARASGAGMLDLKVEGGKAMQAVVKSIDHDIITRAITHVTLMHVSRDDVVKVDLPVVGVGTPAAVEDESGVLVHPTSHVSVRGKVNALPDHLEVDLSGLEIGSSLYAGDLKLPEGLELMSSSDSTIFSLQPAVDLAAELEAEQAAEADAAAAGETPEEGGEKPAEEES